VYVCYLTDDHSLLVLVLHDVLGGEEIKTITMSLCGMRCNTSSSKIARPDKILTTV
jgi:hypothetical protein